MSDVDPDYVLIDISAADGRFAGTTEIYAEPDFARELASALRGFPSSPDDRRTLELGSSDTRVAGGWVSLTGYCVDRAGHAVLRVEMSDKGNANGMTPRSSQVNLTVAPPAIDAFVNALSVWDCALGSEVTLWGQPE